MSKYLRKILLKGNEAPAKQNKTSTPLMQSSTENTMSDKKDAIFRGLIFLTLFLSRYLKLLIQIVSESRPLSSAIFKPSPHQFFVIHFIVQVVSYYARIIPWSIIDTALYLDTCFSTRNFKLSSL